jgi:hypothetical protein
VLFEKRFWASIADGSVTLTFRRWKRGQVVAGRRYRTPAGRIEVDAVAVVDAASITDSDADRAGFSSADALVANLRGTPDLDVFRIEFHAVDEPDPRQTLADTVSLSPADLATIDARLARLDRGSSHGPWTRAVLELIDARPAVRAGDLAEQLGRERLPFKADVRKLKNLGLTLSLDVGYRLSPRGEAFLGATRR